MTGEIDVRGNIDLSGVSSGTLNNFGIIRPAGSGATGVLNITGDLYQETGGVIEIELGGSPASGLYDQINVSGNVALAGVLDVIALPAYNPVIGHEFPAITATAVGGTFDTINPPSGFGITPTYNPADFRMTIASAGGTTNTWLFDGSDDWLNATRWSLGHVPTAVEDVVIPDYLTSSS